MIKNKVNMRVQRVYSQNKNGNTAMTTAKKIK